MVDVVRKKNINITKNIQRWIFIICMFSEVRGATTIVDNEPQLKENRAQEKTIEEENYVRLLAQSDEELFLQGNLYYQQKVYEKALICYDAIKRKGRAVFGNMGICYYYQDKPVEALACWHRAQKGAGYTEYDKMVALSDRLRKEKGAGEKEYTIFVPWATRFFTRLGTPFSLLMHQLLFLSVWYLFFLLLYYSFSLYASYFKVAVTGLMCLLVTIMLVGCSMWFKYKQEWYGYALVRVPEAPLRAGPYGNYHEISRVYCMDELMVHESVAGWSRAQKSRGIERGWIENSALEMVG